MAQCIAAWFVDGVSGAIGAFPDTDLIDARRALSRAFRAFHQTDCARIRAALHAS